MWSRERARTPLTILRPQSRRRPWLLLLTLAAAAATAGAVWACGPYFPNQLLDHRDATLRATPQNSFSWEAMHLLAPTDSLRPHELSVADFATAPAGGVAASQGLTPLQWQRSTSLRLAANGDAAYAAGADLPEDLRLYTAGAIDYAAANALCATAEAAGASEASLPGADAATSCDHPDPAKMNHAIARFDSVLALPRNKATLRGVWAAYMLGRIHAQRASAAAGNAALFGREREAAAKAFQQSRRRAVAGASDTQGLAVSSLGEQARLSLYSGRQPCGWARLTAGSGTCGADIAPADLKHAITLYAAQAGYDSDSAVQSLAAIAASVLADPSRAAALVDEPLSQRLLVAYALARIGDETTPDARVASTAVKRDSVLSTLVQAIQAQGLDRVVGADRLAALAYRQGRYDLAATLAARAPGPLASWVIAKLALHRGDLAAAARAYADAVKAFPKTDDPKASVTPSNQRLITGEQGVLSLARGEYVEAMGHLFDATQASGGDGNVHVHNENTSGFGYGNDLFYMAERVLTVDELKAFVDAHAPASTPAPLDYKKTREAGSAPLADKLRWLLARRLMRSGRFDEALAYFSASGDARFGDVDLRAKAREYASDLRQADRAWTDIGKAEARYAAAVIARVNGMALLGYEQGPDYFDNGGNFQGGSGHTAADLKQSMVTDGERQRFATSAAVPGWRFHYRYIAADDAVAAANLLPPRSQAFAAVLCKASRWMREGPPDYEDHYQSGADVHAGPTQPSEAARRVLLYYARYVKQGAYVSWADNFGSACEPPDFDGARQMLRHQRIVSAKHQLRRFLPYEIGGGVLLAIAAGWWLRRRRRDAS